MYNFSSANKLLLAILGYVGIKTDAIVYLLLTWSPTRCMLLMILYISVTFEYEYVELTSKSINAWVSPGSVLRPVLYFYTPMTFQK